MHFSLKHLSSASVGGCGWDVYHPTPYSVELASANNSGVPRLEKEIDELVFGLYGLTEGEVNLVE